MISRHIVKSCCNSTAIIFETDKPIRKNQLQPFRDADYLIPEHYLKSGLFYVQKGSLIATGVFGATKISVRCAGKDCHQLQDDFGILLEKAINL